MLLCVVAMVYLFAGCEVLKTKRTAVKDSTAVAKVDSGAVKKNETETNKQKDYEKITYVFPPQPRDCIINKYYNPPPTTIIYEKGKEQEQTRAFNYDSAWRQKYDSLYYKSLEQSKEKKSGISPVFMFFTGLGVLLLFAVIGFIMLYRLTSFVKTKI